MLACIVYLILWSYCGTRKGGLLLCRVTAGEFLDRLFVCSMELDDVIVPYIAKRDKGALVAVHQPSCVSDVQSVTVSVYFGRDP